MPTVQITAATMMLSRSFLPSRTLLPSFARCFSTTQQEPPMSIEDMQFFHYGKRPRYRNREKFKSPRKRVNILMAEIQKEVIEKSIAAKPAVWETKFEVGDSVEIEHVEEGGVNNKKTEKIRGVVLGIFRKGIDHTITIHDILFGQPIETTVPLHSPMVKSLKVLQKRFVTNGKKRVHRAKLYYLAEKNLLQRVTKWKK